MITLKIHDVFFTLGLKKNNFFFPTDSKDSLPRALENKQQVLRSIISTVAFSSFKELAASLALTGITCLFVATPAMPTLIIVAIATVAINTLFRTLTGYLTYKLHTLEKTSYVDQENCKVLRTSIQLFQFMAPLTFTLLGETTKNVLIHEAGHALAAVAVYQKARPSIEVFPFLGGVTRFFVGPLSKIGNFLGGTKSRLFVTAAGPAAAILAATIEIGLSHYFKESHPELSRYLLCSAISSIFQHVFYALSTLWIANPSAGHDFAFLWKIGHVHPIAAAVALVALPIFIKGFLFARERHFAPHQTVNFMNRAAM